LAEDDLNEQRRLKEVNDQEELQALWVWDCQINQIKTFTSQVPKLPKPVDKLVMMLDSASLVNTLNVIPILIDHFRNHRTTSTDIRFTRKHHRSMIATTQWWNSTWSWTSGKPN
jgi:hypothetical protein